jgi:hypothetical protein
VEKIIDDQRMVKLKRNERGVFCQLMKKSRLDDPERYCRYLRMDTSTFEVCVCCLDIFMKPCTYD